MQESRGEEPGGRGGGWVQHSQLLLERTFQKATLMLAAAFFDLWPIKSKCKWKVEAAFGTLTWPGGVKEAPWTVSGGGTGSACVPVGILLRRAQLSQWQ